jgi:hypothetical protein
MMAWQDAEQSGARKQYGVVPLYNEVESQFEVAGPFSCTKHHQSSSRSASPAPLCPRARCAAYGARRCGAAPCLRPQCLTQTAYSPYSLLAASTDTCDALHVPRCTRRGSLCPPICVRTDHGRDHAGPRSDGRRTFRFVGQCIDGKTTSSSPSWRPEGRCRTTLRHGRTPSPCITTSSSCSRLLKG